MKDTLVKSVTAKLAKEKGFNIMCNNYINIYNEEQELMHYIGDTFEDKYSLAKEFISYFIPTQSLLAKWLREVHKMDILIDSIGSGKGYYYCIQDVKTGDRIKGWTEDYFTHEDCFEEGLQEALKNK